MIGLTENMKEMVIRYSFMGLFLIISDDIT